MVFVAQVFKRLKLDCQFKQLHEELFHVFCHVNFGSSVILLHGSMVEGVWLSSYDKIWHVFHKYKQ